MSFYPHPKWRKQQPELVANCKHLASLLKASWSIDFKEQLVRGENAAPSKAPGILQKPMALRGLMMSKLSLNHQVTPTWANTVPIGCSMCTCIVLLFGSTMP